MTATLTIIIESVDMQGLPMPGMSLRTIPELLELCAMRISKEQAGSMRIVSVVVEEKNK